MDSINIESIVGVGTKVTMSKKIKKEETNQEELSQMTSMP